MAFIAVYDANVLYPNLLRDLLIRIAQSGLVQAKWTDQILDEVFDNLRENRPDLAPEKLTRTRDLMCNAIRDCKVLNYEKLIPTLDLPDPDDRHVLAAAIRCRAQVIVTWNLKDFPDAALASWDCEAKDPDSFVMDQIHLDRKSVYGAIQRIADASDRLPRTVFDILGGLENLGLVESAAELRQ